MLVKHIALLPIIYLHKISISILLDQFTPLCFSVNGLLGDQAEVFLKRLANCLFEMWDKFFRCCMLDILETCFFALLCAIIVCLRGSRTMASLHLVWRMVHINV